MELYSCSSLHLRGMWEDHFSFSIRKMRTDICSREKIRVWEERNERIIEFSCASGKFSCAVIRNARHCQYVRLPQCSDKLRSYLVQLESLVADSCVYCNNIPFCRSDSSSLLDNYWFGEFIHIPASISTYFHFSAVPNKLKQDKF